jgi:hypothetical protein
MAYKIGYVKDAEDRNYEVTYDSSSGKVWASYSGSGVLSFGTSHYEIGKARSPEEAMMMARAWAVSQ